MLTRTTPYREELPNGLVLRSLSRAEDVERLAAFNGTIHGTGVADMTRELVLHHPDTRPEHWLYVEDSRKSEIVSSLCLIPWTLHYDTVSLQAGEMGIVGTREDHRHQGLVRAQAARHTALLRTGGYHLSHIQGIPYFYRQFGYEYALPLEGGWRLELDMIRDTAGSPAEYTYRLADASDIASLRLLYGRATGGLGVCTARSEGVWRPGATSGLPADPTSRLWRGLDRQRGVAAQRTCFGSRAAATEEMERRPGQAVHPPLPA